MPNGRNADGGKFAMLPRIVVESAAYRALTPNARSLLVEIIYLFDGANNGSLYLSVVDAAARMGVVDVHAALAAFDALQDFGFIELTKNSYFSVKAGETSRARCWRLTWLPGPDRAAPSLDFLARQPEPRTKERKRMERGLRALKSYGKALGAGKLPIVDSTAHEASQSNVAMPAVVNSTTPNGHIGYNPPISPTVQSTTHIHLPYQSETYDPLGWMSG